MCEGRNCSNNIACPCLAKCERHGKCCECVEHHMHCEMDPYCITHKKQTIEWRESIAKKDSQLPEGVIEG